MTILPGTSGVAGTSRRSPGHPLGCARAPVRRPSAEPCPAADPGAEGRRSPPCSSSPTAIRSGDSVNRTLAFWLDLAVKLSLLLLLAFGAFSGLERFAGKAFGWRLIGYSVAAFLVPAIWAARGRRPPYPFAVDTLFVLPFLIDTIGNALDLYDTIDWWDDANHFVNWALLSGAAAVALRRTHVNRAELFSLVAQ
jgi:hypothetical protein